jgi:Zn-dependent M28 family amino/carboxypeptidase
MRDAGCEDRIRRHVETLALDIGERNLWRYAALMRTAEYIEAEFAASGYSPTRQTYQVSRLPVSNIEVVLPGETAPDDAIVVGAHYDTVSGSPGANDNGTGVAALLELARRFAGRPLRRTLRFVAFVNEEPPFFQTAEMGSLVYASAARARGDRIAGMLSLETMGYYSTDAGSQQYPAPELSGLYPDVGDFIGLVANEASRGLLESAARAFVTSSSVPVRGAALPETLPGTGWSDHWSFWQAGYQAMMVTDTAPWRYPHYHTAEDTPDKLHFDSLVDVVNGLEGVIEALAS